MLATQLFTRDSSSERCKGPIVIHSWKQASLLSKTPIWCKKSVLCNYSKALLNTKYKDCLTLYKSFRPMSLLRYYTGVHTSWHKVNFRKKIVISVSTLQWYKLSFIHALLVIFALNWNQFLKVWREKKTDKTKLYGWAS